MAKLTKAQQAEFDQLREAAEMAKALSWPNFPKPEPLPRPRGWDDVIRGWAINTYDAGTVAERWQTNSATYANKELNNGSRSMPALYATKQDAYLALHHEMAEKCAKILAAILKKAME